MKLFRPIAAAAALLAAAPLAAQEAAPPAGQAAPAAPPKLLVVISVDQLSTDLFAQYRGQFTSGLARLLSGAVFPEGYQTHAATETCPGHSTILTGARPYRTGIVANDWTDFNAPRADKTVYCAEDESVPGSDSGNYVVSDKHLKVSTLGEWMKAANPATRVVSVAGKDRAAVMMGGHQIDQVWWWKDSKFVSFVGRTTPTLVERMNGYVAARIAEAQEPMEIPEFCRSRSRAVTLPGGMTVGDGRFARTAGDAKAFRVSPEIDEAVLALGAGIAADMQLGQGGQTDLLILGASATDYVGHAYGPGGGEMCLQLFALDQALGKLFGVLDQTGVDYAVALTADHGGNDIPERGPAADGIAPSRADPALRANAIGDEIAKQLGLSASLLTGSVFGDIYIDPKLPAGQRETVRKLAIRRYAAHPQVEAVFTREQIQATQLATTAPEKWTILERLRASFDPERSGDFYVVLKPRVTPIPVPRAGGVSTHGTVWDYDRRVPILFWRKGMKGFEAQGSAETVDIAPTLAALIGLKVPVEVDGKCLDLDPGAGGSCRN
jgi:predicted AlkP superfamily pyrophosphatase or phosphodiesterase